MIKLDLPPKPIELTEEKETELIQIYKETGKPVWKQKYIIDSLLKMSNNKCAFSEQKIGVESAYLEIEHFMGKKKYEDYVVRWGNLLPCCKKCNGSKGTWDVIEKPLVNPTLDNPKEFLYVRAYRYYPKNEVGKNTIEVYSMNNREHFIRVRSEIGFKIIETLETHLDSLKEKIEGKKSTINIICCIKSILKDCGRKEEYSAVLSTEILEDNTFNELEKLLRENEIWDNEFEEIKDELLFCSLPR